MAISSSHYLMKPNTNRNKAKLDLLVLFAATRKIEAVKPLARHATEKIIRADAIAPKQYSGHRTECRVLTGSGTQYRDQRITTL
jgi:hypothetical protein